MSNHPVRRDLPAVPTDTPTSSPAFVLVVIPTPNGYQAVASADLEAVEFCPTFDRIETFDNPLTLPAPSRWTLRADLATPVFALGATVADAVRAAVQ